MRALSFIEDLAERDCTCSDLIPGAVCDSCNARLITRGEMGTESMKEHFCAECDIGHHERCTGKECDCACQPR